MIYRFTLITFVFPPARGIFSSHHFLPSSLGVAEWVLAVAMRPGLACSVESVTSGLGSKPHCKSASTISGLEWLSVGEWIAGNARVG
jgi:hypothetical protein